MSGSGLPPGSRPPRAARRRDRHDGCNPFHPSREKQRSERRPSMERTQPEMLSLAFTPAEPGRLSPAVQEGPDSLGHRVDAMLREMAFAYHLARSLREGIVQ